MRYSDELWIKTLPIIGVKVTLTANTDPVMNLLGADQFDADGDGELTVRAGGSVIVIVARERWAYVEYIYYSETGGAGVWPRTRDEK